jgi:hypothetical protein
MSERLCLDCGADLAGKRADAQFCDGTCKKRWQRKQVKPDKPKSKSHVVLLKERTRERILGKAQGPSSTPKTEPPHGTDVLPARKNIRYFLDETPSEVGAETIKAVEAVVKSGLWGNSQSFPIDDATAGLPPEALPEPLRAGMDKLRKHAQDLVTEGVVPQKTADAAVKMVLNTFQQLPIQHHGTENDLARQVLTRLPTSKLDPNSEEAELERLQKSQLRTTKKKD